MCLAVPGNIIEVSDTSGLLMGKVDFGGVRREICLAYVPDAKVGDYAIVHVGFALELINEEEARESLEALKAVVDMEDELGIGYGGKISEVV